MSDHTDIVAAVKAALEARGANLSGPCGAFEITRRVAWALRAEGAGTLRKTTGNQCGEHAVDIIAYPDGHIVDILGDAGSENRPGWGDAGVVDRVRWETPVDPGDDPPPPPAPVPVPPPPPVVPSDDIVVQLAHLVEAGDRIVVALTLVVEAVRRVNTRLDQIAANGVRVHL